MNPPLQLTPLDELRVRLRRLVMMFEADVEASDWQDPAYMFDAFIDYVRTISVETLWELTSHPLHGEDVLS